MTRRRTGDVGDRDRRCTRGAGPSWLVGARSHEASRCRIPRHHPACRHCAAGDARVDGATRRNRSAVGIAHASRVEATRTAAVVEEATATLATARAQPRDRTHDARHGRAGSRRGRDTAACGRAAPDRTADATRRRQGRPRRPVRAARRAQRVRAGRDRSAQPGGRVRPGRPRAHAEPHRGNMCARAEPRCERAAGGHRRTGRHRGDRSRNGLRRPVPTGRRPTGPPSRRWRARPRPISPCRKARCKSRRDSAGLTERAVSATRIETAHATNARTWMAGVMTGTQSEVDKTRAAVAEAETARFLVTANANETRACIDGVARAVGRQQDGRQRRRPSRRSAARATPVPARSPSRPAPASPTISRTRSCCGPATRTTPIRPTPGAGDVQVIRSTDLVTWELAGNAPAGAAALGAAGYDVGAGGAGARQLVRPLLHDPRHRDRTASASPARWPRAGRPVPRRLGRPDRVRCRRLDRSESLRRRRTAARSCSGSRKGIRRGGPTMLWSQELTGERARGAGLAPPTARRRTGRSSAASSRLRRSLPGRRPVLLALRGRELDVTDVLDRVRDLRRPGGSVHQARGQPRAHVGLEARGAGWRRSVPRRERVADGRVPRVHRAARRLSEQPLPAHRAAAGRNGNLAIDARTYAPRPLSRRRTRSRGGRPCASAASTRAA